MALVLRKDAKIELMRTVPLFSQCTKRELGTIASVADLIDVPEGTRLVTEGGLGRDFMIIVEGEAEVRRGGRKINTLSDGDFFGEVAVIIEGPRIASVTTTAPTLLLVVRESAFWSVLEEIPSIQIRILKALAERVRPLVI